MSLQNLLQIKQLEAHKSNAAQVNRLLNSSVRCLEDARQESITPETRLEAGYRAIMQLSMVSLWANGYRPTTSSGHHVTMIQSLVHSIGLDADQMRVLDTFRVKRNSTNYTGEDIDITSVEACIEAGEHLLQQVRHWLQNNRPDLIQ